MALTEIALELLASSVSVDDDAAAVADRWYHNFLWGRALTISGGASEIMRGLIGRQLLALPRARSSHRERRRRCDPQPGGPLLPHARHG